MNEEEIIQMPKDNTIKTIKCGDIEIPVEYLRQTTVNVNGDDYIRVQQENKQLKEELKFTIGIVEHNRIISEKNKEIHQLKDNWNKLKVYIKAEIPEDVFIDTEWFVSILDKMQELEQGSDSDGNN